MRIEPKYNCYYIIIDIIVITNSFLNSAYSKYIKYSNELVKLFCVLKK